MNRLIRSRTCFSVAAILTLYAGVALAAVDKYAYEAAFARANPAAVAAWEAAVEDARNPTVGKIYNGLTAITEPYSGLTTKTIDGETYILAVSWKSNRSFYPAHFYPDPKSHMNTLKYPIWVTVAPQIQQFCQQYMSNPAHDAAELNHRLRQLLGLEPDSQEIFFVEVWVQPEDLWRPCPDSEIDDTVCGLDLPSDVDPTYQSWFNKTRATQYTDCHEEYDPGDKYGYPWTQLGYTYDWNADNTSHHGLSEFVIKPNANVFIAGMPSTADYCAPPK